MRSRVARVPRATRKRARNSRESIPSSIANQPASRDGRSSRIVESPNAASAEEFTSTCVTIRRATDGRPTEVPPHFTSKTHTHVMFTIQASSVGIARARAARTTKTTRRSVSNTVARASGVNAARLAPETASRTHAREVAQIAAKAAAPPPPAKLFTEAQYVQASCSVYTVYALQMLLVPAKMVTDHFHATADQMTQFWIRGSGCAWAAVIWAARQMDATTATTMMMATRRSRAGSCTPERQVQLVQEQLERQVPDALRSGDSHGRLVSRWRVPRVHVSVESSTLRPIAAPTASARNKITLTHRDDEKGGSPPSTDFTHCCNDTSLVRS